MCIRDRFQDALLGPQDGPRARPRATQELPETPSETHLAVQDRQEPQKPPKRRPNVDGVPLVASTMWVHFCKDFAVFEHLLKQKNLYFYFRSWTSDFSDSCATLFRFAAESALANCRAVRTCKYQRCHLRSTSTSLFHALLRHTVCTEQAQAWWV